MAKAFFSLFNQVLSYPAYHFCLQYFNTAYDLHREHYSVDIIYFEVHTVLVMLFLNPQILLILVFSFSHKGQALSGTLEDLPLPAQASSRFHLVDSHGNNYLFRGKAPKDKKNQTFAYKKIVKDIQVFLPLAQEEDLFLIDYNLMHPLIPKEKRYSRWEESFFTANPERGTYKHWPVAFGAIRNLNKHLERIRDLLMHSREGKQVAIYLHCLAGCDRTGYVISAYRMRYKGYSYFKALAQSNKECGREMSPFYKQRLGFYCRYLKVRDLTAGDCPELKKPASRNRK